MKRSPVLLFLLSIFSLAICFGYEYRLYEGNEYMGTVFLVDADSSDNDSITLYDHLPTAQERLKEHLKLLRSQQYRNLLRNLSRNQYPYFFAQQGYTKQQVLQRIDLYDLDEFIAFIKQFEEYPVTIKVLHDQLKDLSFGERCWRWCGGEYATGLTKRVAQLNHEIEMHEQQVLNSSHISGTEKIDYFLHHEIDYQKFVQKYSHVAREVLQKYEHEDDAVHCLVENALEGLQQKVISDQQIVFHLAVVNRTVSTLEGISAERAVQLFKRGVTTFITHLHPATQIIGLRDAVIGAAHFVADITIGKLYLSSDQYRARINQIHDVFELLSFDTIAHMTAEQIVDFIAITAADSITSLGMVTSVKFIKRIKALEAVKKAGSKAQHYARLFKNAVHQKYAQQGYRIHSDGTVSLFSAGPLPALPSKGKNFIDISKKHLRVIEKKVVDEAVIIADKVRPQYALIKKRYGECADKFLKLDYKHIFGIELTFTRRNKLKIGGFHFDRKNYFESKKMVDFRNRYQDAHGYYRAELWWNGACAKRKASFFPAHWTVEQVTDAIFEAYDDFIKSGAKVFRDRNGVHTVHGKISTGHTIEMIISPKGKITTAYPVIKGPE